MASPERGEEPLDGDYYRSEEEEDEDGEVTEEEDYDYPEQENVENNNTSSSNFNFQDQNQSHNGGVVPQEEPEPNIIGGDVRESLGFQRARRSLVIPDWEFGEGKEIDDGNDHAGIVAIDRLGLLLVCCSWGILVADTDAVASSALDQEANDDGDEDGLVPARARVQLGGRPSFMAVSSDGERVAVAVGAKVLICRTKDLATGSSKPQSAIDVASEEGDDCIPRALSWGRVQRGTGGTSVRVLLIVRADSTALLVRLSGGGGGNAGIEEVADGAEKFTAGCWLPPGSGKFALGTTTGEVEVYDEKNHSEALNVVPLPEDLQMEDNTEVNHLSITQLGTLLVLHYNASAERNAATGLAEFDIPANISSTSRLTMRCFDDPGMHLVPIPSYEAPESFKFRSHVAMITLNDDHLLLVSNSMNDAPSFVLTTAAKNNTERDWSGDDMEEGWELMTPADVFPRGLCISESCSRPVPPQDVTQGGFPPAPLAFLLTTEGKLQCFAIVNPMNSKEEKRRASVRPVLSVEMVGGDDGEDGVTAGKTEVAVRQSTGDMGGKNGVAKTSGTNPVFPAPTGGVFGGGSPGPLTFGAGKLPGSESGAKPLFGGFNPPPAPGGNGAALAASPFGSFATGGTGMKISGFGSPPPATTSSTGPGAAPTSFGSFASGGGKGTGFASFNTGPAGTKATGGLFGSSAKNTSPAVLTPPTGEAKDRKTLGGAVSSQFKPVATTASDAKSAGKSSPKPASGSSSSAYPPMSIKPPSVFGGASKPVTPTASTAGYPPISGTAPTVFGAPKPAEKKAEAKAEAKPAAKSAAKSAAFPPMSSAAPSVFGSQVKRTTPTPATFGFGQPATKTDPKAPERKTEAKPSSSAYPPMSAKAPTVFGTSAPAAAPTPATFASTKSEPKKGEAVPPTKPATKLAATSIFSPTGIKVPSAFGSASKAGVPAPATAGYPPMGGKAPTVFGAAKPAEKKADASTKTKTAASSKAGSSAYPPMSSAAPTVFGTEVKQAARPSAMSYPPISSTAPSVFGSSAKPAAKAETKPAAKPAAKQTATSSAFPPMSTVAPTVFGSPTPMATKSAEAPKSAQFSATRPSSFASTNPNPFGDSSPSPFGAGKPSLFGAGFGAGTKGTETGTSKPTATFGGLSQRSIATANKTGAPAPAAFSSFGSSFGGGGSNVPASTATFGAQSPPPPGPKIIATSVPTNGGDKAKAKDSSSKQETKRTERDNSASVVPKGRPSPTFSSPEAVPDTQATRKTGPTVGGSSGSVGQAIPSSRSKGVEDSEETEEWKQDFGQGDDDEDDATEFQVPDIPELATPSGRRNAVSRGSATDRRGVPSSPVEGLAWKVVLEVISHLRELADLGGAGPLREAGWSEGMEGGIDGMLHTLGRLRQAVGELGKGTATQVSETARVGANNSDIKWQTETARGIVTEYDLGDEEERGEFAEEDDGRDTLDPELRHMRKIIRENRRKIESAMSDLQGILTSRRERRADINICKSSSGTTLAAPDSHSTLTSSSSRRQSMSGVSTRSSTAAAHGAMVVAAPAAALRGGAIHGVLPRSRRGRAGARSSVGGDVASPAVGKKETTFDTPVSALTRRGSLGGGGSSSAQSRRVSMTPPSQSGLTRGRRREGEPDQSVSAHQQQLQPYERPGLRLLRVVGVQYKATARVEEWVAKAEAKVKALERAVAAEEGTDHSPSTSLLTRHDGEREDPLERGRRLRRAQDVVNIFGRESTKLSFSFPQREVGRTLTESQLAEEFGNRPSLATPQRTPSRLVTGERGQGSVHQPSSASRSRASPQQSTPVRQSPPSATLSRSMGRSGASSIGNSGTGGVLSRQTSVAPDAGIPRRERSGAAGSGSFASTFGNAGIGSSGSKNESSGGGQPRDSLSDRRGKMAKASANSSASPSQAESKSSSPTPAAPLFGLPATTAGVKSQAKIDAGGAAKSSTSAGASYPPMSFAAPKVFGASGSEKKSSTAGPSPVLVPPANTKTAAKPSAAGSAYPPMSAMAPRVFDAKSSAAGAKAPASSSAAPAAATPAKAEDKAAASATAPLPSPFGGTASAFPSSKPLSFGFGSGSTTTGGSIFGSTTTATPVSTNEGAAAPASTPAATAPTMIPPTAAAPAPAPATFGGLGALTAAATMAAPIPPSPTRTPTLAPTAAPAGGGGAFGMSGFASALGASASATATVGSAAAPAGGVDYRSQVVEIYKKYNPSKLGDVDKLMAKHAAKLPELIVKLRRKYEGVGATPAPAATAAAATPASPFTTPGKPAGGGRLFGASTTPSAAPAGPSPFGAGAGFGAPKPAPFGSGTGGASAPAFGQSPFNTGSSGFGAPAAAPATPSPFGAAATTTTTPSPFGTPAATPSPFGAPAATPSPFGAQQQAGQQPSPFAPPPAGRGDPNVLRAWMVEVYRRFKPENVAKVDSFMVKYTNRETAMIEQILKRYGQHGVTAPPGWASGAAPKPAAPAPSGFGQSTPQMGFGQTQTPAFGQASTFGAPSSMGFGGQTAQQQQSPFGQKSAAPATFGAPSVFGTPAPAPTAFGGGSSGFGAPSTLGGRGVFGGAPAAPPQAATQGGFGAFASASQPTFGQPATNGGGGGFGSFASQAKQGGGGGFGGFGGAGTTGNTPGANFSGSSFRQMRG